MRDGVIDDRGASFEDCAADFGVCLLVVDFEEGILNFDVFDSFRAVCGLDDLFIVGGADRFHESVFSGIVAGAG